MSYVRRDMPCGRVPEIVSLTFSGWPLKAATNCGDEKNCAKRLPLCSHRLPCCRAATLSCELPSCTVAHTGTKPTTEPMTAATVALRFGVGLINSVTSRVLASCAARRARFAFAWAARARQAASWNRGFFDYEVDRG